MNELAGVLDAQKKMLAGLMKHIFEVDTGSSSKISEAEEAEGGRNLANLIFNAFKLNKIKAELPSFRITAGLHAAIRWDVHRKYKLNDLHDIHHAVATIPYCDFFFTEHSLRELTNSKSLNLNSHFGCRTVSDAEDALLALSQL